MIDASNLISEIQKANAYTRLPDRLVQMWPDLAAFQKYDRFGSADRLVAMKSVLAERNLGEVIDLGGNSGYFCLSLIDVGMIAKATIYDAAPGALSAGRIMAQHMGIENKITFVEKSIDLEFLRSLPKVDTILCLNLLHHAGVKFDVAKIERDGWEKYAVEWFSEMRSKCRLAIVGLGFEEEKPPHWAVLNAHRAAYVANIAERARWSTLYDANVSDIQRLGVEGANGRYTKGGQVLEPKRKKLTFKKIVRKIRRLRKHQSSSGNKAASSKVGEYHLYIFEGVGL